MAMQHPYNRHVKGIEVVSAPAGSAKSAPIENLYFDGAYLLLDITEMVGGGATLDVTIEAYDPTSDKWFDIGAFSQRNSTGTFPILFYPTGGADVDKVLPATWRIGFNFSGTSVSFTVGVEYVL